jgi:NDP-sugar pyrophosphorylase family protein
MHYAIIAAGVGSRLQQEGVTVPKPLVSLRGQVMIDRLLRLFVRHDAESISIIINEEMPEVRRYLEQWGAPEHLATLGLSADFPFHLLIKNTPGSMHSLAALAEVIPEGRFCLTTVDTIFHASDFAHYLRAFTSLTAEEGDGCFAVTRYVDDEKPLYVQAAADGRSIAAFADTPPTGDWYVSGGIYGLDTRTAFPILRQCMATGQVRMRQFQRALIAGGLRLRLYPFDQIIDVDHADDIAKAEQFLGREALCIRRAAEFSPNHVGNDAAILAAVADRLRASGWSVCTVDEEQLPTWKPEDFPPVILHMARRAESLQLLSRLASTGRHTLLNAPLGVRNCGREAMTRLLTDAGVPHPASCCIDTIAPWFAAHPEWNTHFPGWLKRGDFHALERDDVNYVSTPSDADKLLFQYFLRGISRAVYNEHLHGDLVKFYGVVGTNFFYWFYPKAEGHSKFGLERQNDATLMIPFSAADLQALCDRSARLLGVSLYGGDCIVAPDGTCRIIDFNDWPSYAPCRAAAADAIAHLVQYGEAAAETSATD